MKNKRKDTIKQRVTSRFKGLGAIMLALFMTLTGLPFMPSMEAEAAEGDEYWIIGYKYYRDPLFCTGQESESIDESGNVYEVLSSGNTYNNGYVMEDPMGSLILSNGSSLTSLGTLSNSGLKITISPEEATYVNAGCVHYYEGSGMLFQMKVDGTVKAETTGLGEEGKARFLLDAGKYAVTYSFERLEGTGIRSKFIVDFKSVIDSLTVTPPDATLTFGGSTQTLTVSPASAADKVEWSSEDTKIATVDSDGTVTPVSAGTVTIKATYTPEEGDPIVGTCKVTVNKAESTVAKIPTANNLTYNGKAQELVTAGSAEGGEMQYALGTDEKTEPTTGWSDKVPSNTEAGTYYVWYKVVGDANHTDSKPASVTVTIAEMEEIEHYDEVPLTTGEVTDITGTEEAPAETNPYGTKIVNSESLETLLEVSAADKAAGVNVWLDVKDGTATVPETDKTIIQSTAGEYAVGQYLDVNLFKKVGNNDPVKVSEPNGKVKVSIVIPESLRKDGRTFRILKVHNGEPSVIDGTYDAPTGIFTFETDSFSSYAIAYKDGEEEDDDDDDDDDEPAQVTPVVTTTEPRSPKTGDDMMGYSFWLMLAAAGLAVSGMAAKGRKEQE